MEAHLHHPARAAYTAGALRVLKLLSRRGAVQYLSCGAIVLLIVVLNWVLLSSVNLWVLITAPLTESHFSNPIIGYSILLDGSPFHLENQAPLYQSLTFNGVFSPPGSFSLRAVYPFLVSIGSWSLGLRTAALAINYLSLAVFVTSTFWLACQLCRSLQAAVFAAGLAALGLGSVVHLNDLSAHLLGFAVYAAATCIIFASRVWNSEQPFSVHIAIGVTLAIATLAYPSGFLLTVCYVLVAGRFSKWPHVITAAALGSLARLAWEHFMDLAYVSFFDFTPAKVAEFATETWRAVDFWLALLLHDPGHFLLAVAQALIDCLFVAFPLITIAGVASVALLNRHAAARLWFFGVFFATPYVGAVFFSPVAPARGYLVYCSTFIIFASLPVLIFTRFDGFRNAALLRLVACTAVLAGQVVWSLAPYFGYYFPAVSYYLGFFHASDAFTAVDVVNLAGDAPLWRYFGGPANFVDAGGLPLGSIEQGADVGRRSFGFALVFNAFMIGLAVALVATWANCRPGASAAAADRLYSRTPFAKLTSVRIWRWPAAWAGLSLALALGGYLLQTQQLWPFAAFRVTDFSQPRTLTLGVEISSQASRKIVDALRTKAGLETYIFLRGSGITGASFRVGNHELSAQSVATPHGATLLWRLDSAVLARALSQESAWLSSEILLADGYVGGWQRGGSAKRKVSPMLRAQQFPYWPSFELRLFDPDKHTTVFIGY